MNCALCINLKVLSQCFFREGFIFSEIFMENRQ